MKVPGRFRVVPGRFRVVPAGSGRFSTKKTKPAASNEPINFKERIIWRFQKFGHVSPSPLIIMVIF